MGGDESHTEDCVERSLGGLRPVFSTQKWMQRSIQEASVFLAWVSPSGREMELGALAWQSHDRIKVPTKDNSCFLNSSPCLLSQRGKILLVA